MGSLLNRFDRMEWAGAFGDLGTFIPFLVAYIAVVKVPPGGILLSFGLAMIFCGLYYKTPFPVQPMKGIGTIAATQAARAATMTSGAVYAADLVSGLIWLILGLTGWVSHLARLIPRLVISGIVLGLGMSFMLEGIRMMSADWIVSTIGLAGTFLLLHTRAIPAMLALLVFGMASAAFQNPAALQALSTVRFAPHLPDLALTAVTWRDVLIGTFLLSVPQLPLTLGNAVIATREQNNRLFPDRSVTENAVATSTGIMNLAGAALGGVPMCHGAGGMAGQVTFGARTGGAPIIFGAVLVCLALGFSDSVYTLFNIIPRAVLGVILFFSGGQLALGAGELTEDRTERFATLVTAAFTVWNVGIAFIAGMALAHLSTRARFRGRI
ncbi:MAG TPA: putative sulfate/molybdate transporter [Steroidobacteraceae bacterium]